MIAEMETKGFNPITGAFFRNTAVAGATAEVVVDRSFVNCPGLRHSSTISFPIFNSLRVVSRLQSLTDKVSRSGRMLRIEREANGQVVFTISGRLDAEDLPELKALIGSEAADRPIVLDLGELTLVDQQAVRFLVECDASGIELQNCAPYICEWMARQRDGN